MQKPSRVAQRKIRLMQSELQMLQHYHQQCKDIFGDYESEYAYDKLLNAHIQVYEAVLKERH